jgi:hypothetical protein
MVSIFYKENKAVSYIFLSCSHVLQDTAFGLPGAAAPQSVGGFQAWKALSMFTDV